MTTAAFTQARMRALLPAISLFAVLVPILILLHFKEQELISNP